MPKKCLILILASDRDQSTASSVPRRCARRPPARGPTFLATQSSVESAPWPRTNTQLQRKTCSSTATGSRSSPRRDLRAGRVWGTGLSRTAELPAMSARHVAGEVFAALCVVCWALVPAPQVWKNWRSKTTEGLSPFLALIWIFNSMLIGAFTIVEGLSAGLIAQPFISAFMLLVVTWQIMYYAPANKRDWRRPTLYTFGLTGFFGGVLVGLVFGLRAADRAGVSLDWFAYITTVVGVGGMVPQYYETWKFQRVLGLSLGLCLLDMCGSLFGATSVALATDPLNVPAFVLYIVYAPFVGGMIPLHYALETRWRRLHPEEAARDVEKAEGAEVKEDVDKDGKTEDAEAEPDSGTVEVMEGDYVAPQAPRSAQ
ncbi:hypothetical protein DFJ74DRAFT_289027 [Hyaloraphidium curvatum]|nr:hypothetical protein DFJ74DRAFT_289027 [Hyaloraphidium curvatum]